MQSEERFRIPELPRGKIDMVLDTDTYNEIDDQFAIAYALRSKEKLNVKAIYAAPFLNAKSVSPEDGMEKSYAEIRKLLNLANEDVPVFKGSRNYLSSETDFQDSPAARDLAERAMHYTKENPLYVAAIGAITNVASAYLMNPDIAERVVVVWVAGNSLDWPDTNEFNMMQDIAAARVVYRNFPAVMLPAMGVLSEFRTTGPELEKWLLGKNELCDYLVSNTVHEAESYASGRPWSRVIWDVCGIGWLLNENERFMRDRIIPAPIPEYDFHYSFDARRPPVRYVYFVDRDTLYEDLFQKLSR